MKADGREGPPAVRQRLMTGMLRAMLFATGTRLSALGLLAAVHSAVIVAIGATILAVAGMIGGRLTALRGVALIMLRVAGGRLVLGMTLLLSLALMLGVTLVLGMVLMLDGRGLSGRRCSDDDRDRQTEIFHFLSPEREDAVQSILQESRGGGGSASNCMPSKKRAGTAIGAINSALAAAA